MTVTLEDPPAATVPRMAAPDGTRLAIRHWPAERPWATVLIVHGLAEHSGRYEHVGTWLSQAGLDALGLDLRGFGLSGGERAYVDRWDRYHDDLAAVLSALRAVAPRRPIVLYGHSMGALVALGYAISDRPRPDLLVLGSPALEATVDPAKRLAASLLSRVAPRLRITNDLDGSVLSRNFEVGERYLADPLAVHSTTSRLAAEGLAEQKRVKAALGRLAVPTLVIHGLQDRLVPPSASAVLEGLPNVTRRTWPNLRHELHNEPEGAEVVASIVLWIEEQLGGRRPAR